jgi:hypothetical protein
MSRKRLIILVIVLAVLVVALASILVYYELSKPHILNVQFAPTVTKQEALDAIQGWEKNVILSQSWQKENMDFSAGINGTDIFVGIETDLIQGLILKAKLEKDPQIQTVFLQ